MKQVTIDTVRERIAELEMVNSHGELSLRGEFELACLRMLVALQERVAELEENDREQMAELYRRNATIQRLQQKAAAVSEKMIDTFEAEFRRAFDVSAGVEQLIEIGYQGEKFSLSIRDAATWWKLGRDAMLQGAEPVPSADNTAQQFEALATSGKSEHLLNAERIAMEAKALSDQLNSTSAVHHRVSGWSERQQKVIAYSLWRFSCTAYKKANQAAQTNNKDMFDRFIRDARCAEEIREEFTSAWSGKL